MSRPGGCPASQADPAGPRYDVQHLKGHQPRLMSTTPDVAMAAALRVPYVIAWSDEAVQHPLLFADHRSSGGVRLTYPDSRRSDWVNGVLRARIRQNRRGEPMWRMLNVRRQWRCMERDLCQVCGEPGTDPETGRVWWVITETAFRATGKDGGLTNAPPTCRACIPESLAYCPQLRKSAAVYTAAYSEPAGVLADVFEPGVGGAARRTGHNVFVGFDEFALHPYVLATRMAVKLHDMRPGKDP
ncbi:hypothetical protein ACOZ38_22840 [Sphaerisporangium viridialbum]|uniref:hypothetical protein n=1 Tax=Sphaerisporangium viridialbum TaxID=46189 RepID=UPI003C77F7F0